MKKQIFTIAVSLYTIAWSMDITDVKNKPKQTNVLFHINTVDGQTKHFPLPSSATNTTDTEQGLEPLINALIKDHSQMQEHKNARSEPPSKLFQIHRAKL
jgi:hypothetical protein